MSDLMRTLRFGALMERILTEYKEQGSIFGIRKFVRYEGKKAAPIFKERLESPYGPAAGPNTQLSQNIVASYITGSRFFELKTVQKMDGEELSKCVPKPCITAADECYNCEWSTELTVPQAFAEYVRAWFACKLLAKEFSFGDPDSFVFNMSVGYDLDGIKSEKIDKYIEGMKNAKDTEVWGECTEWTRSNLDRFKHIDAGFVKNISPVISTSITESTLHGCPPEEIERIAAYLIKEKKLNTYIKCNPTLLGYDFARKRLDSLGFDYVTFDDHHFKEDLQWADAVPMFRRLIELSEQEDKEFGLKLSNTFPVDVAAGELPSEEMYMAGRALFPLTIAMAHKVAKEFDGRLRISYSGGADIDNILKLYEAGISPITMATNVLKPGGYERFSQIGESFKSVEMKGFSTIDVEALKNLSDAATNEPKYCKPIKPLPDRKVQEKLKIFDCFTAPCQSGCPIHQDIPAYLEAMREGRAKDALKIILERNTLPFITGTICPHTCADRCMRNYYESSLKIREVKLAAAREAYEDILSSIEKRTLNSEKKVAIIGGGPAGLSAAAFLSRAGISVTIFEQREKLGGVVSHAIPDFRISTETIEKDISLCLAYGAEVRTKTRVETLDALKAEGYTDFIIATGAWRKGSEPLQKGTSLDALEFLTRVKEHGEKLSNISQTKNIAVIGGGNTAMDTARAAKRMAGVEHVRLIYRRTKRYMPADEEELMAAIEDGVEFMELLSPVEAKGGSLICEVMKLGEPDESGRRSPVFTGETREIPADMVISAVGEQIDDGLYRSLGISTQKGSRPVTDENMETDLEHVYAIGDCRRGPATVVKAIADAQAAAAAIAGMSFDNFHSDNCKGDLAALRERHGILAGSIKPDADERCLGCQTVCETCVEVCPNRANVSIQTEEGAVPQIVHIDGMCNECGNCAVFCPYLGAPYRDKFTLFWTREDFDNSENEGVLFENGEGSALIRVGAEVKKFDPEDKSIPKGYIALAETIQKKYGYLIQY